jgi:hypothetical protein
MMKLRFLIKIPIAWKPGVTQKSIDEKLKNTKEPAMGFFEISSQCFDFYVKDVADGCTPLDSSKIDYAPGCWPMGASALARLIFSSFL